MHIQVLGQQNNNGEGLRSAAESDLARLAGHGRAAGSHAFRRLTLVVAGGTRKRLVGHERYATRGVSPAEAATRPAGAPNAPRPAHGPHGGSNLVYRRPDGNIGWSDAGPRRVARG